MGIITDKVYQLIILALVGVIMGLSLKWYMLSSDNYSKQESITKLEKEKQDLVSSNAVKEANNNTLRASIKGRNDEIERLNIDLKKSQESYKVIEKLVVKEIERERIVLRDINDSEDWKQTKRIVHEITELF